MHIKDRTFLLSGGASGLGLATVKELHAHGGYVAILDLNADNGEAVVKELGERAKFFEADVSESTTTEKAVKEVEAWIKETGKPLAAIIPAAGVGMPGKLIDRDNNPIPLHNIDFVININLRGTLDLIRLALPMLARNEPTQPDGERGVIVMVSSSAAYDGQPGQVAYAASKGAVRSLTLPLARDLAALGIRAMTIAPSYFESNMTAQLSDKVRKSLERVFEFPKRAGRGPDFAGMGIDFKSGTIFTHSLPPLKLHIMADIKDWMALAEPSAEWEETVKKLPQRPNLGAFPDIPTLRQYIIESKKKLTNSFDPILGVVEKDYDIATRDGSTITGRLYTPEGKRDCPLVVVFHGGGFCIGGLANEELLCRRAASSLGCVVLNVDYRLAPEHKFPVPVHDCYDSTKWAAENATTLGADPLKGFIIGGTSAGANMAIVSALQYRDEQRMPAITGCLLMIPPTCAASAVPEQYRAEYRSWDQNEHADILSREACHLFTSSYAPDVADHGTQMFSPLLWESGLQSFPRSFFQICGRDPLRDEGLIFERVLREDHSIQTKVEVYPGLPHGFHSVIPMLAASRKYVQDSINGLSWLLK